MFEYDYLTKSIMGYRFFVVGGEDGVDRVVGYIGPRGGIRHFRPDEVFIASMEAISGWILFERRAKKVA